MINTINSSAQHNSTRLPRALCHSIAHPTSLSSLPTSKPAYCLPYTALRRHAKVAHLSKEESAKERLTPPLNSSELSPTTTTTNKKGERNREDREERDRGGIVCSSQYWNRRGVHWAAIDAIFAAEATVVRGYLQRRTA